MAGQPSVNLSQPDDAIPVSVAMNPPAPKRAYTSTVSEEFDSILLRSMLEASWEYCQELKDEVDSLKAQQVPMVPLPDQKAQQVPMVPPPSQDVQVLEAALQTAHRRNELLEITIKEQNDREHQLRAELQEANDRYERLADEVAPTNDLRRVIEELQLAKRRQNELNTDMAAELQAMTKLKNEWKARTEAAITRLREYQKATPEVVTVAPEPEEAAPPTSASNTEPPTVASLQGQLLHQEIITDTLHAKIAHLEGQVQQQALHIALTESRAARPQPQPEANAEEMDRLRDRLRTARADNEEVRAENTMLRYQLAEFRNRQDP